MVIANPLALQKLPRQGRVMRRPSHSWNVRAKPYQMQPICIAPVIPGETLKNAVLQARVVSDPVKNRLIGWWHEYYFYYVPFRAMAIAEELEQMVIDPEWTQDAIASNTPVANHYFYGRNSVDYVKHCLDAVTKYDFRKPDEEEVFEIDGLPVVSINRQSWTDSVINVGAMGDVDQDVDLNDDGTIMASEVEIAMQQYELLRMNGLIDMTYEDYLKTYGITGRAVSKEPEHTPELLRYVRDWQYPSNTVDASGNVASALSWSIAERIDKDRFFREPGFIFGFTVSRPKVYLGRQIGAAASMLQTIRTWLPKVMTDDPYSSMTLYASGEGPLATGFADTAPALSDTTPSQGYYVDVRDLFLYGDQFVTNPDAYKVDLPAIDGNMSYPTSAVYNGLFVDQTGAKQHIEQDGLISLVVAGSQRDHTPTANKRVVV